MPPLGGGLTRSGHRKHSPITPPTHPQSEQPALSLALYFTLPWVACKADLDLGLLGGSQIQVHSVHLDATGKCSEWTFKALSLLEVRMGRTRDMLKPIGK